MELYGLIQQKKCIVDNENISSTTIFTVMQIGINKHDDNFIAYCVITKWEKRCLK